MDGVSLIFQSNLNGLMYKPSEKDNHVIIVSSYHKIGKRFDYIKTEFKNAVIINIEDDFGYALVEMKLL